MNTKIIITDIDSTLTDHWKRVRRNTVPQWPGKSIHSKAWTWSEIALDSLLPYCRTTLTKLQQMGFYVRYCTARGWDGAGKTTVLQLENLGLPNPSDVLIVKNMADKVKIINSGLCDYYIDDFMTGQENNIGTFHKEIAQAIENNGVHVVVFRNDWLDVLDQVTLYEGRNDENTDGHGSS